MTTGNKIIGLWSSYWQLIGVLVLFILLSLQIFNLVTIESFADFIIPGYLFVFLAMQYVHSIFSFLFFLNSNSSNISELSVLTVYPLCAFSLIHVIWDKTFGPLDLFFIGLLSLVSIIYIIKQIATSKILSLNAIDSTTSFKINNN